MCSKAPLDRHGCFWTRRVAVRVAHRSAPLTDALAHVVTLWGHQEAKDLWTAFTAEKGWQEAFEKIGAVEQQAELRSAEAWSNHPKSEYTRLAQLEIKKSDSIQ